VPQTRRLPSRPHQARRLLEDIAAKVTERSAEHLVTSAASDVDLAMERGEVMGRCG
jgi:hypothetical protein